MGGALPETVDFLLLSFCPVRLDLRDYFCLVTAAFYSVEFDMLFLDAGTIRYFLSFGILADQNRRTGTILRLALFVTNTRAACAFRVEFFCSL